MAVCVWHFSAWLIEANSGPTSLSSDAFSFSLKDLFSFFSDFSEGSLDESVLLLLFEIEISFWGCSIGFLILGTAEILDLSEIRS